MIYGLRFTIFSFLPRNQRNSWLKGCYLKKQKQNRPLAGNPKLEARNPRQDERVCLKKQSQFIRIECSVSTDRHALRRNPKDCELRIAYTNLKKQSQFCNGQNELKYLYERWLWGISCFEGGEKTKPNKANFNFTAENAEIAELINIISSFSAVLANSAVDLKKQSQC